jgi:hypothetical protein
MILNQGYIEHVIFFVNLKNIRFVKIILLKMIIIFIDFYKNNFLIFFKIIQIS